MVEKKASYQNLILQASRKAADIQIRATCRAERKTVEALYNAAVAKKNLEAAGDKSTALPTRKTISEESCIAKLNAYKNASKCFSGRQVAPSLTVEALQTDKGVFSWLPSIGGGTSGYVIEEKVNADGAALVWMAMTTVDGEGSSSFTADANSADKFNKEWLTVKKTSNQNERLFRILKVDPCGKMS